MTYLLSKLLPLTLLPLGVSLILLLLGLIGRWRWPVMAAVVLLWICSLGLVSQTLWRWLEAPWQRTTAAEALPAEAIVVLSGGRHPTPGAAQVSEWHDPDRFLLGLISSAPARRRVCCLPVGRVRFGQANLPRGSAT